MLRIAKSLSIIEKILLVLLVFVGSAMFCVRYKMYNISNNLKYLDNKIAKLNNEKELLGVELTYLTSTERILSIIEKDQSVLNDKDIINSKQLKTKEEFARISMAKFKDDLNDDRKLAQND